MSSGVYIRELREEDLPAVKDFTDLEIGQNYFSIAQIENMYRAGRKDGRNASYVLADHDGTIYGVRLSYMPGQWPEKHPSQKPHPELWRVAAHDAGYFQSLFISKTQQNSGWGKRLSMASIEAMKSVGAKAVVCHSWNESPDNSSRRYLESMGFEPVVEIPEFWKVIDYECTRCGNPCLCTATEMIRYL